MELSTCLQPTSEVWTWTYQWQRNGEAVGQTTQNDPNHMGLLSKYVLGHCYYIKQILPPSDIDDFGTLTDMQPH